MPTQKEFNCNKLGEAALFRLSLAEIVKTELTSLPKCFPKKQHLITNVPW